MQDRVSLYPGRVRLTPVPEQENTYDMVRADEPTQVGTQLNKASLLSDEVSAAINALSACGVPETPNEAFNFLTSVLEAIKNSALISEIGSYIGTGGVGESNKNSLTFSFVPKIVIIFGKGIQNSYSSSALTVLHSFFISVWGYEYSLAPDQYGYEVISYTDKTMSWYSALVNGAPSETTQFNVSGEKYSYIAIG